jgi:pimeloyl-ACP methyl ester carboxylesterase
MKWVLLSSAVLACLAVLATGVALWIYRDIPAAELEAKYRLPQSRFVELDGVRMHVVEQGEGPVVVLVHAHYANLRMWNPWVERLARDHRVIRFDLTSHGLTGPDPSGDYTLERGVELMARLVDGLALQRFVLAGASTGGTHALHYAARHPERVERLVLLNPGVIEGREKSGRGAGVAADLMFATLQRITPRFVPRAVLRSGFADPDAVDEALVTEWHELWLRAGQRPAEIARMRQYQAGDVDAVARQVRAPVLLMWGEANRIAPLAQARELRHLLVNAAGVELRSYPGVGHMATYEAPDATARGVADWLAAPRPVVPGLPPGAR